MLKQRLRLPLPQQRMPMHWLLNPLPKTLRLPPILHKMRLKLLMSVQSTPRKLLMRLEKKLPPPLNVLPLPMRPPMTRLLLLVLPL